MNDLLWAFACFAAEIEAFFLGDFLPLFDFFEETLISPTAYNSCAYLKAVNGFISMNSSLLWR